MPQLKISLCF